MKKAKCFLLALTLTVAACGGSGGGSSKEVADQGLETDQGNTRPGEYGQVPKAALTFATNVQLIDMTSAQEAKFDRAIEIVKLVVATEEFRARILNHTYQGVRQFVDSNGLSNTQVYNAILEAAEKLYPARNNTMDLEVVLYTASTNIVGYTYPNVSKIWVNTKYFDAYTAAGVAHNLMHEWLHKLGFGHDAQPTPSRPYSVPYAIGSIVADIGKDFL